MPFHPRTEREVDQARLSSALRSMTLSRASRATQSPLPRGAVSYWQPTALRSASAPDVGEGSRMCHLGSCQASLGGYQQAIDLLTQALAISRDIGDRYGEAVTLDHLGRACLTSGETQRAVTLLEQAVAIADTTGAIEPGVGARSGLARAHLHLGNPAAALALMAARRALPYPVEEPAMRLLEGLALLELQRPNESTRAFSDAIAAADSLLALADRNVAALHARALALSGLAVAADGAARFAEAGEAFARAEPLPALSA